MFVFVWERVGGELLVSSDELLQLDYFKNMLLFTLFNNVDDLFLIKP